MALVSSYFNNNGHDTLMQPNVGETHRTTLYFCFDSFTSASSAEVWISNPDQFRCSSPALMKGSDFSMHSTTKFKCNFTVIGMVHLGIKMTGRYFSEFR